MYLGIVLASEHGNDLRDPGTVGVKSVNVGVLDPGDVVGTYARRVVAAVLDYG